MADCIIKPLMEAIIFCGIQASGKTTFYQQRFFKTHVRISLDLFNTRRKEKIFLETCLLTQQRFVIDNTNFSKEQRQFYIQKAKDYKFKVVGYFFITTVGEAITRNKNRTGKEFVPAAGICGTYKKLQPPEYSEGFDEIYEVRLNENGFAITLVAPETIEQFEQKL
jgi:predicted kinase